MARKRKRIYRHRERHEPGTPPGTLTRVNDIPVSPPAIRLIGYGPDDVVDVAIRSVDDIRSHMGKWPVLWVNIDGLADPATVQAVGEIFNLHPLALEDTIHTHQRPKTEEYAGNLYTVCRMANELPDTGTEFDLEQVSLFLGKGFVVSFQEIPGDCWEPVRERIRQNLGRYLRTHGADYLLYALLDSLVDSYFPLLERIGDRLENLEDRILANPREDCMIAIQGAKRSLHTIRNAVWPMRESIGQIIIDEEMIAPGTKLFLRDCQDHVIQILDIVESYRERTSEVMDIYLSSLSHRMNEVMRVLTVISMIFMPLTFIVGVYGMNFDTEISPLNMPELKSPYGYPAVMIFMLLISIGMVAFFKHKGWLGGKRKRKE